MPLFCFTIEADVLGLVGAGLLFPSQVQLTAWVNQSDPIGSLLGPQQGWLLHDPAVHRFSDPGRPSSRLMDSDGPHAPDTYLKAMREANWP